MDLARKIAIAIVMIIPAFVIAGLLWALVESWAPVVIWEIVLVIMYFQIIKRISPTSHQHT